MTLDELLSTIREWPPYVTYGVLFLGSLAEYIVPPVPGDTVVVASAVLVAAFGWSVWPIFAVVTAGAVLGAAIDFWFGGWLIRTGRIERLSLGKRAAIDDLVARFHRHGAAYLAVNRFLPGVRAFFFVAAGLAELRLATVLLWSTLSAMAWNALLIAAGYALGDNLPALEAWLGRYQAVMWGLIAVVVGWVGLKVWRASRKAASEQGPPV